MTINRDAFDKAVGAHSPLRPADVDRLFGGVTAENKRFVWRFLQLDYATQIEIFRKAGRARLVFPGAVLIDIPLMRS